MFDEASKRGQKKRSLDDAMEVIQEFSFTQTSQCLQISPDRKFVAASGVYKPQVKMFEVDQLSLKFERHMDAECVRFRFLSEDFRKLVLLRSDRTVCAWNHPNISTHRSLM